MRIKKEDLELIDDLISGKADPLSDISQKKLSRNPLIAVTLEKILDSEGLTDESLVKKIKGIINRKPEVKIGKAGKEITNQTTVDKNAMDCIKMLFQMKGKFNEKHDSTVSSEVKRLSDGDLDKLIKAGSRYLEDGGKAFNK